MSSTLIGQAIAILNVKPESAGFIQAIDQPNPLAVARRAGEKTRGVLLSAHRYHLSSDFTRMASIYGFNVDDPIDNFLNVARPPFDQMWLEWPVEDQLMAVGVDPSFDNPVFTGVLVTRQPKSPSRFMITTVNCIDLPGKMHVEISALSVMVDTEKPIPKDEFQDCFDFLKETLRDRIKVVPAARDRVSEMHEDQVQMVVESTIVGGRAGEAPAEAANVRKIVPHTAYCFTPGFHENFKRVALDFEHPMGNALRQVIAEHISEHSGSVRFVLGALALMNQKEYVTRQPVKPGAKRPGEEQKPRIQPAYEFVTMSAPHQVVIKHIQGRNENEAKREHMRHEVSGTWVTYHKTGKADCAHVMVNRDEHGNKKICVKCGLKRTWRGEHERGNIELGFKPRKSKVVLGE